MKLPFLGARPSAIAIAIAEGDAARDQRDWSRAAQAYGRALNVDPQLSNIWVQYGHALKESGQREGAEEAYRKALAIDSSAADTHLQLGHVQKLQGNTVGAVQSYFTALKLKPTLGHARHELILAGWTERDIAEALSGIGHFPSQCAGKPQIKITETGQRTLRLRQKISQDRLSSFDPAAYIATFSDVAKLIEIGIFFSPEQHYDHYGYRQGREILATLRYRPPSRVIIMCPSFYKRCGIGEHSRHLADSIEASGLETFRIRTTSDLSCLGESKLKDAVLIVNHGPGLMDSYNPELSEGESTFDMLSVLRSMFERYNLRPIIFMHSLLDRDNAVMFPRQQFTLEYPIPIVTTIEAAARAFNIFRVEHGMQPITPPKMPTKTKLGRDYPAIGFFGFFQWGGKNFDALLNVAQALKAKIVGSIATREASQVESLRKMLTERQIICDLGTGWASEGELVERLSEADYHYLPQNDYDHWNNSGTARLAMNLGRPVIVPPHSPFLDLRDYAIFAEEHDVPAIIAWMRNPDVYKKACERTSLYAKTHSMLHEMPRLATDLHTIAGESGARNFIDANLFSAYRLLSQSADVFDARVRLALSVTRPAPALCEPATQPDTLHRAQAIGAAREARQSGLAMTYPAVPDIEYWRDHYDLDDFLFLTSEEACINAFRCIIKQEPTLFDYKFGLGILNARGARSSARHLGHLLAQILKRPIGLDFALPVQIYRHGVPLAIADLEIPDLGDELETKHQIRLALCQSLQASMAPCFDSPHDRNLLSMVLLRSGWMEQALQAAAAAQGLTVDARGLCETPSPMARFRATAERLARAGLRPSDMLVIDAPVVAPINPMRAAYCLGELWPFEGDEFIVNSVRALRKREPSTFEMFMYGNEIDRIGKVGVLKRIADLPGNNAQIVDLDDTIEGDRLSLFATEYQVLVRQFRSPHAGGFQMRNAYLEAKRNFSRTWMRIKRNKDIWWAQGGQNIDGILGQEK